jgi:Golgi phosphoprotein 3 (GPP34)
MTTQSLPYRTYLMACDTDASKLYDRTRTAFLVNAAALTELVLSDLAADDHGFARVTGTEPAGDPVLDGLLTEMAAHRRSWKAWLRHHYRQTLDITEHELAAAGTIRLASRRLGGRRTVTVADTAAVKTLQAQVAAVLAGEPTAGVADPGLAALGLLAATGAVRPVLRARSPRGGPVRSRGGYIGELATRLDTAASPLGQRIRGLRMVMVAAQGGMGGS